MVLKKLLLNELVVVFKLKRIRCRDGAIRASPCVSLVESTSPLLVTDGIIQTGHRHIIGLFRRSGNEDIEDDIIACCIIGYQVKHAENSENFKESIN